MTAFCDACRRVTTDCLCLREWREAVKNPTAWMATYRRQVRARGEEVYGSTAPPGELRHRLSQAGCPFDAVRAAEAADDTPAVAAARDFGRAPDALFLVLLGGVGVGKTVAATVALRDFARTYPWQSAASGGQAPEPMAFVEARTLTRLSVFGDADRDAVERLRRTEFLALDDVGQEATELGKSTLVDLLLHRHAKRRRTVLTANCTAQQLRDRYGDALWDRVRSSGLVPTLRAGSLRQRVGVRGGAP